MAHYIIYGAAIIITKIHLSRVRTLSIDTTHEGIEGVMYLGPFFILLKFVEKLIKILTLF